MVEYKMSRVSGPVCTELLYACIRSRTAPPDIKPVSLVTDSTSEGGSRRWGMPKQTWRDTFREDMEEMAVSGSGTHDEARSVASGRARWRQLVAQCTFVAICFVFY